jgi:CIC family chloride channel protein
MKSRPSALRDFTVDRRVWMLAAVALYSDETCRAVAEEMATTGVTSMPVVDRETELICGIVSAQEMLACRRRAVVRESERNSSYSLASRAKG